MNRIKKHLENFKHQIIRGGNNLKTSEFHQMLHVVDYITNHGCPMSYDGSHDDKIGKLKIKTTQSLPISKKVKLNFNIVRRIYEEDIVDEISTVY